MKYKQRQSGSLDRSEGKTETIPGEYGSQFISSKFEIVLIPLPPTVCWLFLPLLWIPLHANTDHCCGSVVAEQKQKV